MTARRPAPARLYRALPSFVIRVPLLSVQAYLALADEPDPAGPPLDRAKDPRVNAALCAGSPQFHAELERADRTGGQESLRSSLLRYLIRMSTRPTPFGLFAAAAIGYWGDHTDLRLDGRPRRVGVRPDMGWLFDLVLRAERDGAQRVVRNPCAFEADGRVHLADRSTAGHVGQPDVSIRATDVVRRVLAWTRTPRDVDQLVTAIVESTEGATRLQAEGLIRSLRDLDLLLSDLRPPLTGDPVAHVISRLAASTVTSATATQLAEIRRQASAVAGQLSAAHPSGSSGLTALRAQIQDLHPPTSAGAEVVQVDSTLELAGATLSRSVADDAAYAAELLLSMNPAPGGRPHLAAYRTAFRARYGEHRAVPVLELLDPRYGLGQPTGQRTSASAATTARRSERLLQLAATALRDGAREVALTEEDISALSTWRPAAAHLPASLELSALVAADSVAALNRGDYRLIVGPNLGAQAAGRGLGRFADMLGTPAGELLAAIDAAERDPRGAIDAELVYLPAKHRSANVTVRPAVRDHEIPVGVSPGVDDAMTIGVHELAVYLDDGWLRLWWTAGDRPVHVRAGHMLNTVNAPAVVRFLQEIDSDGVTSLALFDWGSAALLPALPRVRAGRVVLRPAQWRLRPQTIRVLLAGGADVFRDALARWRHQWGTPRHVYLAAGDNRLLLDLDDPAQAEQLRRELRRAGSRDVVLHEPLPGPEHAWLPGPDGGYLSEVVVPLALRQTPPASASPAERPTIAVSMPATRIADRLRPPGSDWLFLCLYGPRAGQDDFLRGPLWAFAQDQVEAGHVDGWFFLRYADSEPHLRLRLHGRPEALLNTVLPQVTAWAFELTADGVLRRFSVDVYEREIERYGGEAAISTVERIFCADSIAIATLPVPPGGKGRLDLIDVAVLGIDTLLASLGLDAAQRRNWARDVAPPPRESGPAFRDRSKRLRGLLAGSATDRASAVVHAAYAERRAAIAADGAELARLASEDLLTTSLASIARSLVHMHCNRLGLDQAAERLALGLLERTLRSLQAAPPASSARD